MNLIELNRALKQQRLAARGESRAQSDGIKQ
jgi:hypothetical protein